ncbi:MAG: 4Fe-4S dicluster domain-containing protein [PVC group bacterium]
MERKCYFLSRDALAGFLSGLARARDLYYPREINGDWRFVRWNGDSDEISTVSPYRAVESLKNFLFPERVAVAGFPAKIDDFGAGRERIVLGLKACDLACLPVLDYIFREGECSDPFYMEMTEKTILVSGDCTRFKDVCFCPIVGREPYPREDFDLNLSELADGFLLETASERGERLIAEEAERLSPPSPEQLRERDTRRSEVLAGLRKQLSEQGQIGEAPSAEEVKAKSADPLWREEAASCVECGACNLVCPTCHCFILEEVAAAGGSVKYRNWDSCQYPGFPRVAGGANPRPRRSQRLSNRFSKKFQFFPDVAGVIACTGCGRCFEACMGKIDIRSILKRIKST